MAEQSAQSGPATAHGRRGSLLLLSIFAIIGIAILTGLGIWQLRRLEWKLAIIARMESRMSEPATALPPESLWPALEASDNEYKKFRLRGIFDHAREVYVFRAAAEKQQGPGYHVLTPLTLANGAVVFINRGFVPERLKDPALRKAGQLPGEVSITGVLRKSEERNSFTPDDKPSARIWFTRDPKAMAEALSLQRVAPFVIDADAAENPGGWPKGGAANVRIRNDHLSYALTWFALAATLLAVFAIFVLQRLRAGRQP